MASIVTVGSAVLDRVYAVTNLPEPDGGAFVIDETERAGGVAANVSCALATLDHEAAVISRVGRDEAAAVSLESLAACDVDTSKVRRGDDPSSYTVILRGPDGDRMIVAGGDSVPGLELQPADRPALRAADVVFTSAYAPDSVVRDLLEMRADSEITALAFDLSGPVEELAGRGTTPETIDAVCDHADLLVTNRVAARSHFDRDPETAARWLAASGLAKVAVTVGEDGAFLATEGGLTAIEAAAGEVVDTTGAGDAFTAALIHTWVLGDATAEAAGRAAAVAAAKNCTARGPRGALATRADLP